MDKKNNKIVVINFVAKHSYPFIINMVRGLVENGCNAVAIVSKNMPEIEQWRKIESLELFEVDGYTTIKDFLPKLFKYYKKDVPIIKDKIHEYENAIMYIPMLSYWSYFVRLSMKHIDFVYDMHDPISHSKKRLFLGFCNYRLGINAKKIRILSESFREYVREKYKKSDNQIVVIPSGYENVRVNSDIRLVEYDDNKFNFLFQGRIDQYKGLEILARAYKKLAEENSNVTLTIAGSGDISPYSEVLDELPRCTIINRWLKDEEVSSLFNDKNVVVVLPYLTATQSGVINVAMPLGTPIIASDAGAISEQIKDGVTGYLVQPGDPEALYLKMKYVVDHKNELDGIRENAYERMRSLDWNTLSRKLMSEF